jgi:predicted outer membrane repeat protein
MFDCNFIDNYGTNSGGGIAWKNNKKLTILHCYFKGNSGNMYGGGIFSVDDSSIINITIELCVFEKNKAGKKGMDIYLSSSSSVVVDIKMSRSSSYGERIECDSCGVGDGAALLLPDSHGPIYISLEDGLDDILCGLESVFNSTTDANDGKPCHSV